MDPTIAGALIGGGAALIGFGASAWQNASALRASREDAREQRLWEKRSALYESLLTAILDPDAGPLGDPDHPGPIFAELRKQAAQVQAYASEESLEQYRRAMESSRRSARRVDAVADEVRLSEMSTSLAGLARTMRNELQAGQPLRRPLFLIPLRRQSKELPARSQSASRVAWKWLSRPTR